MTNKRDAYHKLSSMLDSEIAHSESLIAMLEKEQGILPKDSDTLLALSLEKDQMLKTLESCHLGRTEFIQACGYNGDQTGLEQFIAWCDERATLAKKWSHYRELVRKCRSMNQLNGSVLDTSLRVVKQALNLLYGQQITENTYDASGRTHATHNGRTIAKA